MKCDELDLILDEALASYSLREPRLGLAGRVMARVTLSNTASPVRWWWVLLPVAAALACLAITLRPPQHHETPLPARASTPPPVVIVKTAPTRPSRPKSVRLPKRERFPSPAPLTPAEQALVAVARQSPEAAAHLAQPDAPLVIEAIDIRPLQIDGLVIGEIK
jgi:hypothetical protein